MIQIEFVASRIGERKHVPTADVLSNAAREKITLSFFLSANKLQIAEYLSIIVFVEYNNGSIGREGMTSVVAISVFCVTGYRQIEDQQTKCTVLVYDLFCVAFRRVFGLHFVVLFYEQSLTRFCKVKLLVNVAKL